MAGKKKTTKNFARVIRAKLDADPKLAKAVDHERLHADIAEQIVRLRTDAKLTQKELAEHTGTKQSVISRIEDADYHGHSLSMLQRIADVFDKRLFVVFCTVAYTPTLYGRASMSTTTMAEVSLDPFLVPTSPFQFARQGITWPTPAQLAPLGLINAPVSVNK